MWPAQWQGAGITCTWLLPSRLGWSSCRWAGCVCVLHSCIMQGGTEGCLAVVLSCSGTIVGLRFPLCRVTVQVKHFHKAAVQTIAGRWRNLHTAAAFGAWLSFVAQRRQHKAAASAVAARWQNLHLSTAFGCWRQAVADAAERATVADAFAGSLAAASLAAAFREWRWVAARKARLRRQESQVSGRQQRLYKELAYGGWKEVVQWPASKRATDAHWKQVVQRSVLALWCQRAQKKAGYQKVRDKAADKCPGNETCSTRCMHTSKRGTAQFGAYLSAHDCCSAVLQTAAVVRGRTHQQLLRRSMSSWQLYVRYRHQKATADAYAASKMQQQVFFAWGQEAGQARSKATAAVNLAARVQARVQLTFECFAAWREQAQRASAVKVGMGPGQL